MDPKMNNTKKIALSCVTVLFFVGGAIIVAEYLRSVSTLYTNQKLQAIAVPIESEVMAPNGCYINRSDIDKAVISSGNITLPFTDNINEWHNITRNATMALMKKLNVPKNESLSLGCVKGNCTYQISKGVKANCTSKR